MSILDRLALAQARYIKKPFLWAMRSTTITRALFTATVRLQNFVPRGIAQSVVNLGGVPGQKLGTGSGAVLCLHGGGFAIGSSSSHAPMAGQLAKELGRPVYVLDYRRVPEHPFPAALDDCVAAYRALLGQHNPSEIAITGDSAGGALCLSLLHVCARENLALPGAMVLMSPACDFRPQARAALVNGPADAILSKRWAMQTVTAYLGAGDGSDPLISPAAQDFAAAPPSLIHFARGEALTPQIETAAEMLRAAGAEVAVKAFDVAYHSFQIDGTPNAKISIRETAAFMDTHLK